MICKICGNNIPDDSKFCINCGNVIDTEKTDVIQSNSKQETSVINADSNSSSSNINYSKEEQKAGSLNTTGIVVNGKYRKILIVCAVLLILFFIILKLFGGSSNEYVKAAYDIYTDAGTQPYFAEDYKLNFLGGKITDRDSEGRKMVVIKVEEEAPWGGEMVQYELALVMYKDDDGDLHYYKIYTCGPGGLSSEDIEDLKEEVNWGRSIK